MGAIADSNLDQITHVSYVEEVRASMARYIMQKRSIRAAVIGGGSPCQANSSLNRGRQGLKDPRSNQPEHLCRTRDEFKKEFPDVPVLFSGERILYAEGGKE